MSLVLDDEGYLYDLLGNRLNGGATFDANNALLSNDEAVFEYDLNGNLIKKTVGTEVTVFVYDVGDRLVRVEDGSGGVVAEYYYDPFGRRLFKEVEGVRTYFVYSDEGLVGEFYSNGVELRGYGFRPNSTWTTNPLFLKVGGEYFWYLNDHLGTPQKIVDSQGVVVWEGVYESFGLARVDVEVVGNNLRFAGQYFDFESGLHYNWWRFYDPGTGRYFRVDPIGLDGGINTYKYALNNPLRVYDPFGLEPHPGCVAACTFGGGIIGGFGGYLSGGLLGGAGGTLVAPGVGTVGGAIGGAGIGGAAGAIAGSAAGNAAGQALCPNNNPQCNPPAGTICYFIDRVPPSKPHYPLFGSHYHLYEMIQAPNGKCFWNKLKASRMAPPGAIPCPFARKKTR